MRKNIVGREKLLIACNSKVLGAIGWVELFIFPLLDILLPFCNLHAFPYSSNHYAEVLVRNENNQYLTHLERPYVLDNLYRVGVSTKKQTNPI